MAGQTRKDSSMQKRTHKGVDNIMDKAESLGGYGKEQMARFKRKTKHLKRNINRHIQKNPERSVWVATGFGIVAGTILTAALMRRKRKR